MIKRAMLWSFGSTLSNKQSPNEWSHVYASFPAIA